MSQEHDKIIKLVQSSTHSILGNYRERAELLRECSEDVFLENQSTLAKVFKGI
jgi:hypothetical protein